jgi:hypothetical protein
VAYAFLGPPASPIYLVEHIDYNGQLRDLINLLWSTCATTGAPPTRLRLLTRRPANRGSEGKRSLRANAALPLGFVGLVLVDAEPSLRLVLYDAGPAFDPPLAGDLVAVRQFFDAVRAACTEQPEPEKSSHHTRSTGTLALTVLLICRVLRLGYNIGIVVVLMVGMRAGLGARQGIAAPPLNSVLGYAPTGLDVSPPQPGLARRESVGGG